MKLDCLEKMKKNTWLCRIDKIGISVSSDDLGIQIYVVIFNEETGKKDHDWIYICPRHPHENGACKIREFHCERIVEVKEVSREGIIKFIMEWNKELVGGENATLQTRPIARV